jgi:hypothetical protein
VPSPAAACSGGGGRCSMFSSSAADVDMTGGTVVERVQPPPHQRWPFHCLLAGFDDCVRPESSFCQSHRFPKGRDAFSFANVTFAGPHLLPTTCFAWLVERWGEAKPFGIMIGGSRWKGYPKDLSRSYQGLRGNTCLEATQKASLGRTRD